MNRLLYSLRLVMRSLRRDPAFSAVMIVTLALSVSLFVTAMAAYRRARSWQGAQPRFASVFRIESRANPLAEMMTNEEFRNFAGFVSFFVSPLQSRPLLGSGIPEGESATLLGNLWGGPSGRPQGPLLARFCRAELFALFALPFRYGTPWREGSGVDGVVLNSVVLNDVLNDRLFAGQNSVGRVVLVEGQPFTVAGVLAPPPMPFQQWDFNPLEDRGEVFIPWALAEVLRPAPVVSFPPIVPGTWEGLSLSPNRFVEHWVSLPDPDRRVRFEALMATVDKNLTLVPYDRVDPALNKVPPPYILFLGFTVAVVLANVLNVIRLLLAKGMARSAEIGIHRALGAPRNVVFSRQLMEGVLVVLGGSVIGVLLGIPIVTLFDRLVPDSPNRLALDLPTAGLSLLVCVLLSLLAGFYPAWRVASVPPTRYLGRI